MTRRRPDNLPEITVGTQKELSAALGVSIHTLRWWARHGCPVAKIEGTGFYDIEAVVDWAEKNERVKSFKTRGDVEKISREIELTRDKIEYIKTNYGTLLRKKQAEVLEVVELAVKQIGDKITDASVQDAAKAILALNAHFGTLFDKMRLEEGQSTENVSVVVKAIMEAKQRQRVTM